MIEPGSTVTGWSRGSSVGSAFSIVCRNDELAPRRVMVTSLPVMLMENCLRESRLSLIRHCSRPIGDVPMVKECSTVGELHSCESFARTSRVAMTEADREARRPDDARVASAVMKRRSSLS